jgi:hypothetical protein
VLRLVIPIMSLEQSACPARRCNQIVVHLLVNGQYGFRRNDFEPEDTTELQNMQSWRLPLDPDTMDLESKLATNSRAASVT